MNVAPYIRPFLRFVTLVCATIIITILATSGVEIHISRQRDLTLTSPQRLLNLATYPAYITIQAYDPARRMLVGMVHSNAVNTDLQMQLPLSPEFSIERQDAMIENGVFTGVKPKVPASLSDIKPGTRGMAVIRATPQGTYVIYLLIGNPFPRP